MMVFKSFLQLLLLLTFQLNVFAQVIVPFALIGYLDDATKACDEYNCGGTLLVNGTLLSRTQSPPVITDSR